MTPPLQKLSKDKCETRMSWYIVITTTINTSHWNDIGGKAVPRERKGFRKIGTRANSEELKFF